MLQEWVVIMYALFSVTLGFETGWPGRIVETVGKDSVL